MTTASRFVLGGIIVLVGLLGLVWAAASHDDAVYVTGLVVFGIAALAVLLLIRAGRPVHRPGTMRDEGPMPLTMRTEHGLGAPPPPFPPMPGQGVPILPHAPGLWSAAAPWLRGGGFVLAALVALIVASMSEGTTMQLALLAFVILTLIVFRYIQSGGRPTRLMPNIAPATPGNSFALGALIGLIALIALVTAAGSEAGDTQTIALMIAVIATLLIFILIGQSWDRAEANRQHGS